MQPQQQHQQTQPPIRSRVEPSGGGLLRGQAYTPASKTNIAERFAGIKIGEGWGPKHDKAI